MTNSTFLVVDDEPDLEILIQQRFRRQIRANEFSFHFARNGSDALEELKKHPEIEVILTDLNMPVMDGLALLARLSEMETNVQRVVVSAYGDLPKIRAAMNRGAFDFLTKPIDFEDLETTIRKALRQVGILREMAAYRRRVMAVERELEIAREIQQSTMPARLPSGSGLSIFGEMEPARHVGGDFFNAFARHDGTWVLVLGDVSGKGIPAALFMAMVRTVIRGIAARVGGPAEILTAVNSHLAEEDKSGLFVTACVGVFHPEKGRVVFAMAGHPCPFVVSPGRAKPAALDVVPSLPLGAFPDSPYREQDVDLAPGETWFTFSDGVIEVQNHDGERLGMEGLAKLLSRVEGPGAKELVARLHAELSRFRGDAPPHDDVTMMALDTGPGKG